MEHLGYSISFIHDKSTVAVKTQKYRKSPLIEVVCEFRFDLETPNDATLPGMFFGEVKEKFPIKKQRHLGTIVPIDQSTGENEMVVTQLAQFYNNDETLLVQVGNNMLTINCLKTYPHWENFKPEIMENFNKFIEIANPKGVNRIGLRCINKIYVPNQEFVLGDFFKFFPSTPQNVITPLTNFNLHIETALENGRDVLVMKNSTIISDKAGSSAFFLDFEYIMNQSGQVKMEDVEEWIEKAHIELYNAFDNSISDKLKEEFEPIHE